MIKFKNYIVHKINLINIFEFISMILQLIPRYFYNNLLKKYKMIIKNILNSINTINK